MPLLHQTYTPKVRCTFVAGTDSPTNVDRLVYTAVKLLAAHWYGQRASQTADKLNDLPQGWKTIVDTYRLNLISDRWTVNGGKWWGAYWGHC